MKNPSKRCELKVNLNRLYAGATEEHLRVSRSSKYQWKMMEAIVGPEAWHCIENDREYLGESDAVREHRLELRERLLAVMLRIIHTPGMLSEAQLRVLNGLLAGHNQVMVAKLAGIGQSTITKTVWGSETPSGKRYGGIARRLQWEAMHDPEYQAIVNELNSL